jgi:deoxyribonuclease IV
VAGKDRKAKKPKSTNARSRRVGKPVASGRKAKKQEANPVRFTKRNPQPSPPPELWPVSDHDVARDAAWLAAHAPLGAHTSIAGGTHEAPVRGKAINATAMQIFTKMANRWAERVCEDEECTAFISLLGETAIRETCAHDSYLINLASPDPVLRDRSIASFTEELRRSNRLGLNYLVSHPGNYMDDRESGLARNAEGITRALEAVSGNTILLMETTAGSGTVLGASFEEMADLLDRIPASLRARVGVCVDTAHIFAAGYDLVSDFEGVWERFADIVGMHRLRMMHLNDSKAPLGSRRDRHELIGEGMIGEAAFRKIMNDPRFESIAKVIETPKLDNAEITDRRMLNRLRSYIE